MFEKCFLHHYSFKLIIPNTTLSLPYFLFQIFFNNIRLLYIKYDIIKLIFNILLYGRFSMENLKSKYVSDYSNKNVNRCTYTGEKPSLKHSSTKPEHMNQGKIIIISGPSASGKSAIVNSLISLWNKCGVALPVILSLTILCNSGPERR